MYTQQQVDYILRQLCRGIGELFPHSRVDAILFGSYARSEAETGSDVDVLILCIFHAMRSVLAPDGEDYKSTRQS